MKDREQKVLSIQILLKNIIKLLIMFLIIKNLKKLLHTKIFFIKKIWLFICKMTKY